MDLHARPRASVAPALLFTLALVGAACTACGDDDGGATSSTMVPTCTPAPTEAVTLEGKTAIFDLADVAEPIAVTTDNGYIVIDARAVGDIPDLSTKFQQVVTDAGFDIAGTDDEGDEAEVFFSRGDVAAGQVRMNESDCAGFVDVKISVLDDPAVLPTS